MLAAAGIDRGRLYITNAVKHFKFVPRGKRRIHQKPGSTEILACSSWLAQERAIVRPRLTLLLGASAGRAVLGRTVAVMRERSRILALPDGGDAMLTVHPAYILRLAGRNEQERAYRGFVADLKSARDVVSGSM
jgi:DNA polymerase